MKKNNPKNKIRTPGIEEKQQLPSAPLETEPSEVTEITETEDVAESEAAEYTVSEEASEVAGAVSQIVTESARHVSESTVLSDLTKIDPDLLSGEESKSFVSSTSGKTARKLRSASGKDKYTKNDVEPVEMDLSGSEPVSKEESAGRVRGSAFFLIISCVVVIIIIGVTMFFESGLKDRMQSPLMIKDSYVDSAEFSFMYHYLLIDNGVDIFAADTPDMLKGPAENPEFDSTRDYFLDLTAQEMQTMQILYDDATSKGYEIENKHFDLAQAYIDWLALKANELGVPLDTYIRGVFGSQVSEQCVLNTLARKYFTEDYASGAKLVELQATEEQAEEAYQANRNIYDLVDYKILRITYEQREEAFINTANLHAQEIIDSMEHDPSRFESCAAEYFSGEAKNKLLTENSTLVSDSRYSDFSHTNFRDWLFDQSRVPGDATIFTDEDGFPIIICFVQRQRQSVPLRDVRMVHIILGEEEGETGLPVAEAQRLAQEIYDKVEIETDMQSIENLYNDYILDGSMEVSHSSDTYPGKFSGILNKWIFSEERKAGDKAFLDTENGYYIVYLVSISEKPEWYDRVNSFIRMNNYQAFLNEMKSEYDYNFIQSGVDKIQDVP